MSLRATPDVIESPASRVRSAGELLLLVSLPVYVVTLPLLALTLVADPVTGKGLVPADIAFVGVVAGFVLAGQSRWLPLQRDLAAVASVLLIALAVSAVMTGTRRAFLEIARVTYSMIVLLVLAHLRLRDGERVRVHNAWVLMALALAIVAFVMYVAGFGQRAASLGPSIPRAAVLMHPNTFSLYLGLSLAVLIHQAAAGAWRPPWDRAGILGLIVVGALTVSRGFAGLMVTLAIVAYRTNLHWLRRWRAVLIVVTAAVVGVLLVSFIWALTPLRDGAVNTANSDYGLRLVAAYRMFVARPVFGLGLETFGSNLCRYTTEAERLDTQSDCAKDWDPHSTWGAYTAETGAVGLFAWVTLYAVVLAKLLKSRAASGTDSMSGVASAAMVGVVWLGGFHVDFTHVKLVWAFLGFALASCEKSGPPRGSTS